MDADKVKLVLERPSININAVNASGRSALHIAAIKDSAECIEMLIDHRKKKIRGASRRDIFHIKLYYNSKFWSQNAKFFEKSLNT